MREREREREREKEREISLHSLYSSIFHSNFNYCQCSWKKRERLIEIDRKGDMPLWAVGPRSPCPSDALSLFPFYLSPWTPAWADLRQGGGPTNREGSPIPGPQCCLGRARRMKGRRLGEDRGRAKTGHITHSCLGGARVNTKEERGGI